MTTKPITSDSFQRHMKRRPFIACFGSFALAGCLESVPGLDSGNGGLRIVGIRHDDSSDYEGWQEHIEFEHVQIENTTGSATELDDKTLRYDETHSFSLPPMTLESGAILTVMSKDGEGNRLDQDPPVFFRFARFEQPATVLESPGSVTLLAESGKQIDQEEY